ncbi:MAG: class I SAM-dependent methyltransferase [Candidatus Aenigmatarchaeota archaeon]
MKFVDKLIRRFVEASTGIVGGEIANFIENGEDVLDFGCGNMMVANVIKNKRKVAITGIDSVDYNLTENRLILYDGKRIPFGDSKFDTVVSSLVFHHCDDPEAALRECVRVSRKKVIVIEDYYTSALGKFRTKVVDWIANRIQSGEINIPFNFKSVPEWEKTFSENGLDIVAKKSFRIPTSPNKYMLFVLNKRQNIRLKSRDVSIVSAV